MLLKFLFITITGVSLVHADVKTRQISSNYECGNYHELCDPNNLTPCCQKNDECTPIGSLSEHYCLSNAGLGMECQEDNDCTDCYSVCSRVSHKCICDENYITQDNSSCWPIIGGNCDLDSNCVPNNSVCLNGVCQCEHNFLQIAYEECAEIYLGLSCQEDKNCYDINRAICSENQTCTCRENSFADNGVCRSLINGYCDNDHDCSPLNTLCIKNKCRCKPAFLPSLDRECVLSYFNQLCKQDEDCYEIDRAMCSEDKRCICRPNHQTVNNSTCISLIGGFCWHHSECLPENSICIFDKCQCNSNFKADESNSKCLPKLGNFCELDEDCEKIRHAKCSKDNKCICRDNNIALNDSKCAPLLGGFCWKNELCAANNSVCADNICRCQDGFSFKSKFECSKGFFTDKRLGKTCQNSSECGPQNSRCIDKKCQCKVNFIPKSNVLCIPAMLGYPCEINEDCAEVVHAMCSKDKKICSCRPNNVALNSSRCAPLLGGFCWKNEPCATVNSVCVDSECQCKDNYKAQSQYKCTI